MEYKYVTWIVLIFAAIISCIGLYWFVVIVAGFLSFILGCITILYLQHEDLDKFLGGGLVENPLQESKNLGLGIVCEPKPSNLLLISPDIKIQTEAKNRSNQGDTFGRKKNLLDAGIELFFKSKHAKEITSRLKGHNSQDDTILDSKEPSNISGDEKKWKPFENIKIYTDRRRRSPSTERGKKKENIQIGEDCSSSSSGATPSFKSYISDVYENNGDSPRKRKILSGCKPIDKLIHTIIDFVIRDYLDSWYSYVSDSKEFTDIVVRETVEASVINVCQRIKYTQFLPLMTTKLVDDLSTHMRLYRLATQEVEANQKSSTVTINEQKRMRMHEKLSPQKRSIHRRNKSDTDLSWHLQKNVANSKFYTATPNEESLVGDPETMLLNSFFNNSALYKKESLDDDALVEHLKIVAESILYFILPEEEFDCMLLRTFLCNLLANIIFKPVVHMLADPDFINLQIAKQFIKDPPSGEFLLKTIRQSNDLSELRAVRQLITKEMDLKYKDISCKAELDSLKYTQKIIDLRISSLQNNRNDIGKVEKERFTPSLPILTLDDILSKELAVSYYLDYLSILNLQKYVLFYLAAQEWKLTTSHIYSEIQVNKAKSRDDAMKDIRDKAQQLFNEYLVPNAANHLNVDIGLVEALNIRIKDMSIQPENTWFDSICKFVYEKLKNEEVFLSSFYQSSAYKKLLFELDVIGQQQQESDIEGSMNDGGSDTCSGDFLIDVTDDDDGPSSGFFENDIKEEHDVHLKTPEMVVKPQAVTHLSGITTKHARSHSDCTGLNTNMRDITIEQLRAGEEKPNIIEPTHTIAIEKHDNLIQYKQKLSARIINTALHVEGNYAVYAIQVFVIEDNQQKSWHIYRRYSKFLELKKILVKKFPRLAKIPFPTKKVFQNTQRAVLEHRMMILNQFLDEICAKAENDDEMHTIIRNFLEPDTDDRKMYGGVVVKTIESLKSGMRTIRNMPDTLVGGISRIFLGKGPLKVRSFYDLTFEIEQSEYPALESMLNLLDEVFDLQNKSQWLRRGLINRVLGAPWVSHTTNKKIIHAAKTLLEMDKVESVLLAILNTIWPHGERHNPHQIPIREDSTKLRTKMAAKISLFALLFDDLKHVVGTVTCNAGLLLFFQMLQKKKLNIRLVLIVLDHILTLIFQTDSLTKHVAGSGSMNKAESTPNSNASSRKPSRF